MGGILLVNQKIILYSLEKGQLAAHRPQEETSHQGSLKSM